MTRQEEFVYNPVKIDEMKEKVMYYLCPDRNCDGFWNTEKFMCEYSCPRVDDLKKILYLKNNNKLIILPGNHSNMQRVNYETEDGRTACYFHDGVHSRIIYEMPE